MSSEKLPDGMDKVWERVQVKLRALVGDKIYNSWFTGMKLERVTGDSFVVSLPTRFLRNWIRSHYLEKILMLVQMEAPSVRKVDLFVRSCGRPLAPASEADMAAAPSEAAPAPEHNSARPSRPAETSGGMSWRHILRQGNGEGCNATMTFTSFVAGPSNAMALAAAQNAARRDPDSQRTNPLYLHGAVGLGKTHLLNAIANEIRLSSDNVSVLFLSAERFMFSFVAALRSRDILAFKNHLRETDVLLIDDMQFLKGPAVQQEFFHTFNELVDARRQVVIAGDLPPMELGQLDKRMQSRLGGGLVVKIGALDRTHCKAMLNRKIEDIQANRPGFAVPPETVDMIVGRINRNGRQIEGAINRLVAQWELNNKSLNAETASAAVRDLLFARSPESVRISDIYKAVGEEFNISKADLISSRRHRSIARPRQIAMFLAKEMTTRSLPEIGRSFGGKDHTTVLYAIRRIRALQEEDPKLKQIIMDLRNHLESLHNDPDK